MVSYYKNNYIYKFYILGKMKYKPYNCLIKPGIKYCELI
jgi:hypothetical protein